jgi:hypothetical protein
VYFGEKNVSPNSNVQSSAALGLEVNLGSSQYELALDPQQKERGDHLLTDISDSLRVREAVVLEGLP